MATQDEPTPATANDPVEKAKAILEDSLIANNPTAAVGIMCYYLANEIAELVSLVAQQRFATAINAVNNFEFEGRNAEQLRDIIEWAETKGYQA